MLRHLALIFVFALASAFALPASAQPAGALVSADPIRDPPAGMQAWKIRYRTTMQDGSLQEVTGIVAAPEYTGVISFGDRAGKGMRGPPIRRVIAWTHGAWGVAEKCGPSLAPGFLQNSPGLGEMIRRGYVVVAPDYPGLASAGQHGFLVGRETAQSVLDAVRAAGGIPGAGAGSSFAVWGESQGGHAALWTAARRAAMRRNSRWSAPPPPRRRPIWPRTCGRAAMPTSARSSPRSRSIRGRSVSTHR